MIIIMTMQQRLKLTLHHYVFQIP